MPQLTFIVGAPRSGTSAITSVFAACGARMGDHYKTLHEHKDAKRWINGLLASRGFDRYGQKPIPMDPIPVSQDEMRRLWKIVEDVDVVKDVKYVWVWRQLVESIPGCRFVYVERDPVKVARSCIRTSFMRAYGKHHASWYKYARAYQKQAERLCEAVPHRSTVVSLSDAISGRTGALRTAIEASGLVWCPERAAGVLDASLWHGG